MAIRIRELPLEDQPVERLRTRGPAGLSAAELITIVAGLDSNEAAEALLAAHDGLTGLSSLVGNLPDPSNPGMDLTLLRASRLGAAFELGRRLVADWPTGQWQIRAPRDLADRLILQMGRLEREELRVVILNTKNVVLRVAVVYQSNVSSSLVRIGELFRDAVRLNAASIILVHNHPSGDPAPSADDLHLTSETLAAGRLLNIDLLDHLIIGHDAFISLRDRGVNFDRSR